MYQIFIERSLDYRITTHGNLPTWTSQSEKSRLQINLSTQGVKEKYGTKIISENLRIYGTYVHQCINSWKIFWRQLTTDQLNFGLGSNLSHDTRNIGLNTRFTLRDRQLNWSRRWEFCHGKTKRISSYKNVR